MVYTVLDEDVTTWYASLLKNDIWKLGQVKGIGKETVQEYLKHSEEQTPQPD